jgi:hypothetical protein
MGCDEGNVGRYESRRMMTGMWTPPPTTITSTRFAGAAGTVGVRIDRIPRLEFTLTDVAVSVTPLNSELSSLELLESTVEIEVVTGELAVADERLAAKLAAAIAIRANTPRRFTDFNLQTGRTQEYELRGTFGFDTIEAKVSNPIGQADSRARPRPRAVRLQASSGEFDSGAVSPL